MANIFPNLKRITQENSFYCGPASLQMLLSFYHVSIDQQSVVDSLNISHKIAMHGMTIQEMGQFVKTNFPQLQFWYKFNSSIDELFQLVNNFKLPIGVEWQGIFDYPDEEILEDEDDDPGHIAVVTEVNIEKDFVKIADPDSHYAGTDRTISLQQFEYRWWDINEINGQQINDFHGLFLITPVTFSFPESLKLIKP